MKNVRVKKKKKEKKILFMPELVANERGGKVKIMKMMEMTKNEITRK